jgi:hypothetical protein
MREHRSRVGFTGFTATTGFLKIIIWWKKYHGDPVYL